MPTYKPIRHQLLLRPSISGYKGAIAIPEIYKDNAIGTCLILARGSLCHPLLQPNTFVMIEHSPKKRREIVDKKTEDFLIDESKILGVILRDKKLRCLGDTVLFERDLRPAFSEGGIITQRNTSQNLHGWIRGTGFLRPGTKRRKAEVNINSYCRLTQWQESMRPFYYEGKYYLIVESKDILFEVTA